MAIYELEQRVLFDGAAAVATADAVVAEMQTPDVSDADNADNSGDTDSTDTSQSTVDSSSLSTISDQSSTDSSTDQTQIFIDTIIGTYDASTDGENILATPDNSELLSTDSGISDLQSSHEVVFIDALVKDADTIVASLDQNAEVVYLDSSESGIAQITDYLSTHEDISSVQIVSEGNYAQIMLGDDVITADNIENYKDAISSWQSHLTSDADILFYGCDIAKDSAGQGVLNDIANWTGADVAASTDTTGIQGDWDLEYTTGNIEANSITVHDYNHNLETYTVTSITDDGTGADYTLSWAINSSNATTTVDDTIAFNLDSGDTVTISGALPAITDGVTIEGNGVTIAFDGGYSALKIDDGSTDSQINVTINDLIITNTSAGAVSVNNSEDLTITNSSIDGIEYVYAHISNSDLNPKVLLVSSALEDVDDLAAAAKDNVIVLEYNPETTDLTGLTTMVNTALNGKKASSIAFATHGLGENQFYLTGTEVVSLSSTLSDTDQQEFWQNIGSMIQQGGRIDLLACNLAEGVIGEALISSIENSAGVNVAASTDATGNSENGGNWTLETDNISSDIYFNSEALKYYTELMSQNASFTVSDLDGGTMNTFSVALGDVDNDGDLDIIVGNYNQPNQLLTNNGNGSFTESTLAGGSYITRSVALGDVDNDGYLDIIVGNDGAANQLLTNNGNGSFTESTLAGGSYATLSVALGDADNDGYLDIIVGNANAANQLLTNNGNGTFTASDLDGGSLYTYSVALGDVDNDGYLDIIVGNANDANQLLTNNGNGTFTASTLAGGSMNTLSVALGDVDNDGYLDIIVGNNNQPNQLLTNNGNGIFTESTLAGDSYATLSVALGDVDNDGDLDIIVGNDGAANQLLTNDGNGSFTASDLDGGSYPTLSVALGDVDNDGDLDIIVGNNNQANQLLINTIVPIEKIFVASTLDGGTMNTYSVALGDVDNDGDLDIIVGNYNQANQLLTNNGNGTFTASTLAGGSMDTYSVALGDVDNDGDLDIIVGNANAANQLLTNNGGGIFTASTLAGGSYNTGSVALGDVDNDGDLDIIVGNYNQANQLLTNDGNGGFTTSDLDGGSYATRSVALGDADNDGDLDIIVGNDNQVNQLLTNDGGGIFTASTLAGGSYATLSVALGDVDNDGDLDIIVGNYNKANQLLTNNGGGGFTASDLDGGSLYTYSVALGDADNDGDLDIIVGNSNQANQLLTNDGGGIFTASTLTGDSYNTASVALGDVDNDGDLDIIVGNYTQANQLLTQEIPIDHYEFSTIGDQIAGDPISFTITAINTVGDTAAYYTGTAELTDSHGMSYGDYTFVAGVVSPTITITAVDTYTLTATDTTDSSITGTSNTFAVIECTYKTQADGNWNTVSNWLVSTDGGSTWAAATDTPDADNSVSITVLNSMTVSADVTIDQTTINSTASIIIDNGVTLTIANGTEDIDLDAEGSIVVNAATGTLLIASGASVDSEGTFTVNGVLSFDDGSANNGTLNLAGTSITIASLTAGSGTITYDVAGQMIAGVRYNALQLSGSGTITATGTLEADSLTVDLGVTLEAENLIVSTTFTNNGTTRTSEITVSLPDSTVGGTFVYAGPGVQIDNLNGNAYNILQLSSPGPKTATGTLQANTLTVDNGIMLQIESLTVNTTFINDGETSALGTVSLPDAAVGGTFTYNGIGQAIDNLGGYAYSALQLTGNGTNTATGTLQADVLRMEPIITLDVVNLTVNIMFENQGTTQASGAVSLPGAPVTGTFIYDGTSQTIDNLGGAGEYQALQLSGSGTKTLGCDVNVTNTFTLDFGVTTEVGAHTLTVTGASDINGTVTISTGTYDANGDFDATGGDITFTDNGNLKLGGATITNLGTLSTDNGTVWYDRAGDQTVLSDNYHNLRISGDSGSTKTLGGLIRLLSAGDLTIDSDTTLDVSASNYGIFILGNWVDDGTFNERAGTVAFYGTAQSIGAETFYNLTTSGTGTQTLEGTVTVENTLNTGAGTTFALSSYTLNIGSANAGAGSWTNSATFNEGTGTVNYAEIGDQSIVSGTYYNLTTSGSGTKTLSGDVSTSGNLEVGNGTTLEGAYSMTVGGNALISGLVGSSGGALTSISITGITTIENNIFTSGVQTYTGAVTLAADASLTAYDFVTLNLIWFKSTVSGAHSLTIDYGNAKFDGTVGSTPLTSLSVSGTSSIGANITTTGVQTYTGAVTLTDAGNTTTFTTTNSAITFTGGVTDGTSSVGLTVNAGSAATTISSAVTIDGTLTKAGSGNFVTNGNDITTGGLTVTAGTFNSGNSSGTWDINGDVTIALGAALNATSGTFTVSGSWSNSGTFTANDNTVTFDGNADQTISGSSTFYNLTIANTGDPSTVEVDASTSTSLAVTNNLLVNDGKFISATDYNNVSIASGAVLELSGDITVSGNWSNSGTFTPGAYTVTLDGADQEISAETFYSLVSNGAGLKTLTGDVTIENALTLTSGIFILGNYNMVLRFTGNISGTGSSTNMIASTGTGKLRKYVDGTSGTFSLPVGTYDTGTSTASYSPASISFAAGTYSAGAYVEISVTADKYADNPSTTDYLNRYWDISSSGITNYSATVSCTYLASDVTGTEADIEGIEYASGVWSGFSAASISTHSFAITAANELGIFTGGEAASLDYFEITTIAGQTAGSAFSITITAYDQYGNIAAGYTGTATLSDTSTTITPTTTAAFVSGVNTTSVTVTQAGTDAITATDGLITDTSNVFTVVAGAVDHVTVTPDGDTITAGETKQFTASAYDEYGNLIASNKDSFIWTQTSAPDSGLFDNTTADDYTVSATYGGKTGYADITVVAGAAAAFDFTTIAGQTAGTAFSITITAYDQYGNIAAGYTGTATLSDTSTTITPTTTAAFVSGVNTTSVTVTQAGTDAITATDGLVTDTSNSFTVAAARRESGMNDATITSIIDDSTGEPSNSSSHPTYNFGVVTLNGTVMNASTTQLLGDSTSVNFSKEDVFNPDTENVYDHKVDKPLNFDRASANDTRYDDDTTTGGDGDEQEGDETAMIFNKTDDYLAMIAGITDGESLYSITLDKHALFKTSTDIYLDAIVSGQV